MTSLRGLCLAAACVLSSMVCAGAAQALAPPPPPPPTNDPAGIVVKIDRADGYSIADVAARFPLTVSSAVLASRGLYLVRSTDPKYAGDPKKTAALAGQISHSPGVVYAEPDLALQVADTQFHSWQYGSGTVAPSTAWSTQPAVTALGLPQAHQLTEGAGVVVAVLDTGEDLTQPALAGPTLAGWNYVDDNADTSDPANGTDSNHDGTADSAAGHGTFVAGMVRLVAPRATILPERVLDSDGNGNVFVVAQAIADAQAAGAKVINLSFGTAAKIDSKVLDDVLRQAQQAGVVVTVAAGNDASTMPHYPAARPGVLSVGALNASGSSTRHLLRPRRVGPGRCTRFIPGRADPRRALRHLVGDVHGRSAGRRAGRAARRGGATAHRQPARRRRRPHRQPAARYQYEPRRDQRPRQPAARHTALIALGAPPAGSPADTTFGIRAGPPGGRCW